MNHLRYPLFLACLLSMLALSAQNNRNVGLYVTLNGGLSLPTGQFAENDPETGGYANPSAAGLAGVGLRLSPHLAIGAHGVVFNSPVDDDATLFPTDNPWKSTFLLATITGILPIGELISADLAIMAGPTFVQFPAGEVQVGGVTIGREAETGTGLGVGGQLGLNYHLDEFIAFRLGATYLSADPSFEQGETFDQRIATFIPQLGLTFTL
jgi:hypothetical protein